MHFRKRSLVSSVFALAIGLSISADAYGKEKLSEEMSYAQPSIPVVTTDDLAGYTIKDCKGIVRGITVRQPTLDQQFKSNIKSLVGGRISPLIGMVETARQQAFNSMVSQAQELGANAIVGVRFSSSSFGDGSEMSTEFISYGTAVVVERKPAERILQ
jgi:uncharacterized protein YbjQ (UPF0145 family)